MSTPPDLEHRDTCSRPPLRPSADIFDRARIRWRCPDCGRTVYEQTEPTR